jgi:hypothetical protein
LKRVDDENDNEVLWESVGDATRGKMMKIYALIVLLGLLALPFTVGISIMKVNASSDGDRDQSCDSSYPNICIVSPPPDLNCDDISDKNFEVVSPDPHGFDRDGDGKGCEN